MEKMRVAGSRRRSTTSDNGNLHAGVRFFLGEIAGQSQIGDADVSVFVEKDVGRLQIAVDDESPVHVFQT